MKSSLIIGLVLIHGLLSGVAQESRVVFLALDEEAATIYEKWPPSPLDTAVLLRNVRSGAPHVVAMVPTFSWPAIDATYEKLLRKQAKGMDLVMGCVLDVDALQKMESTESEMLALLSKVSGSIETLALSKGFASLPHPSLLKERNVGFTKIDFGPRIVVEEEAFLVPLLARVSGDRVVPALPLLALIQAFGSSADSVSVVLEERIELTPEWAIDIDAAGRIRVPYVTNDFVKSFSAEEISPAGKQQRPEKLDTLEKQLVFVGRDDQSSQIYELPSGEKLSHARVMAMTAAAILEAKSPSTRAPVVKAEPPAKVAEIEIPKPLLPAPVEPVSAPIEKKGWSREEYIVLVSLAVLAMVGLVRTIISRRRC